MFVVADTNIGAKLSVLGLQIELYCCKKTHDLECAEVENALCSCIGRCSCVSEAEGHVQNYSDLPIGHVQTYSDLPISHCIKSEMVSRSVRN
jgi:hypothetical protein